MSRAPPAVALFQVACQLRIFSMDQILRADGAVFSESYLGLVPGNYGSVDDEYRSLREGVGVCYVGEGGYVEITGSQRGDFLNRLATNKLDQVAIGSGKEAFMADAVGRIIEHILVFSEADRYIVRAGCGRGQHLFSHLDYYLIREDVRLADRSSQWQDMIVAGIEAEELLAEVATTAIPKTRLDHITIPWWGKSIAIRRLTDKHFPAFLLTGEADVLPDLWQTLRNAGADACGLAACDAMRIEEGWPQFGLDITEKTLPQEVGRNEQAISFDKGCYIGQETVAKIDSRDGVRKLLCGVVIESTIVPSPAAELIHAGQVVGQVTSARWSPGQQAVVALAYLLRDYTSPGTEVMSPVGAAKVVPLPMVFRGAMTI